VLVVAPHVDDEVLCGATIARITEAGADVLVAALSPAIESIPEEYPITQTATEFTASCEVLDLRIVSRGAWPVRRFAEHKNGIREHLNDLRIKCQPDVVICPSSSDLHQDHEVAYKACMRIFRNCRMLMGWESPNNERGTFSARIFIEITEAHLQTKIKAWRCYKTQQHRKSYTKKLIRSLATVRGEQCRCAGGLAEAFELMSARL
jgi:LmbE family N-acetylglucosaminyl deacetylase